MYFVSRVLFKASDGSKSNSIQDYEDEISARKRYYSILASDIGSDNILYELTQIVREDGICIASQVFDYRPKEEPVIPEAI